MSSNLKKLKSNFSDKELFDLALTHKSASKKNNERLEFLGDAIINFYVTQKLYENYADIQEGKLTRLRASLVSREFLNDLGLAIGLSQAVKLGKGESTENNSIVGNALEAVVGAIFLDTGLEDTNHLYRIRANWKHIMMGMKAMGALPMDRRPIVDWKFLVFPYNEHQVEDARKLANSLGMDGFLPVTSERQIEFYNTDTPELYEWPNDKA